ncbi:MAG: bacillithiol system redox-active protein YtxJ [Bacteroidota bacterium]|jgi:bacillithiol system protein YtxJ
MHWHKLNDINQLTEIMLISNKHSAENLAVLLFKHSTRCSISALALNRLESKWTDDKRCPAYYLDLLNHRDISSEISSLFNVEHASPQVLLIKNGKCFYSASHTDISTNHILEAISTQTQ